MPEPTQAALASGKTLAGKKMVLLAAVGATSGAIGGLIPLLGLGLAGGIFLFAQAARNKAVNHKDMASGGVRRPQAQFPRSGLWPNRSGSGSRIGGHAAYRPLAEASDPAGMTPISGTLIAVEYPLAGLWRSTKKVFRR